MCGNKVDQRQGQQAEGRRCVGAEEGEKMAREYSAIFMETSSKDGQNILDSLVLLAREMCSNEDVEVQTSTLLIRFVISVINFFQHISVSEMTSLKETVVIPLEDQVVLDN